MQRFALAVIAAGLAIMLIGVGSAAGTASSTTRVPTNSTSSHPSTVRGSTDPSVTILTCGGGGYSPQQPAVRRAGGTETLKMSTSRAAQPSCSPDCSFFCFAPSPLGLVQGDTVTWTNQSGFAHTVTRCTPDACDGVDAGDGTDASFTSGDVGSANGDSFSHRFEGSGTYNYYCQIHGYALMHGTVTVQASTPSTTASTPTTRSAAVSPSPTPAVSSRSQSAASNGRQLAGTGTAAQVGLWVALGMLAVGVLVLVVGSRGRGRRQCQS